jgi:aminopeptidase N
VTSSESTVYLKDYSPPPFLIPQVELDIDLISAEHARVKARLAVRRNPAATRPTADLGLDLDEVSVESVAIDDGIVAADRYRLDEHHLTVLSVPDEFTLTTVSSLNPKRNTRLMGIYTSSTGFFSLCEAEGFRRITPFADRPDVMARYSVTLRADRSSCPVLLANGNLTAQGEEAGDRHWARWEDPFPKPSYLFAVVAAKLDRRQDHFRTRSGRTVQLQFFVEPGKLEQGEWALASLKRAMKWDEDTYGREIDLDQYNVVAVGDFNAGAMENKGLNIFNTKLVLARQDISTDWDFYFINRTVAHEYFHNWTGNRVTCRDWFQLALKEGLTVFREQQYAGDQYSRPVARIQAVRNLRTAQFPEDAGPMAHAVRPTSYQQISNFYTSTIYNKGAELVGMMRAIVGETAYREGIDLYFRRHDGQAVTTDELVASLQDASGIDLGQFKRWYDQAGTPRLDVTDRYDAGERTYDLVIRQSCPPTAGQPEKLPLHVPLAIGLLDGEGRDLPLRLEGEQAARGTSRVLQLRAETETYRFVDVPCPPVPSLGRGFSAPVIINYDYSDDALQLLLGCDSDPFNRWDAGQQLVMNLLLRGVADHRAGRPIRFPEYLVRAFGRVLADGDQDPAFAAEALVLPAELVIAERLDEIDPAAVHSVRLAMRRFLAERLQVQFREGYERFTTSGPYQPDAVSSGRRALHNLCLAFLVELDDEPSRRLCIAQLQGADNMTDALAALTAIANCDCAERRPALAAFHSRWKDEPLVVDKWLGVEASSRLPGTVTRVRELTGHPSFTLKNPNKVYALLGSFGSNQVNFHAADGSGYELMAEQSVALDAINPQVASRLLRNFERYRRFEPVRSGMMRSALQQVAARPGLSRETAEVVGKALA